MPIVEDVELGFSTADAHRPTLFYGESNLVLSYVDWQGQVVQVIFRKVIRFEWTDDPEEFFDGEPLDGVCLVVKSGWLPSVLNRRHKHYRLNFNAIGGRLEVGCKAVDIVEG
jgi:hypothetical protein